MVTQQGENSQEILPAAPIVAIAEPAPPTPLRVTCPRCRVPVEAGGVYCRVCGQMIEKSVEKPIEIPQQKPAERPQQKPVERLQEPLAPPIPLSQPERTTPGTVLTASMNWGRLVQLAKDGSDEAAYPISSEQIDIGSQEGSVILQGDPYVSPRHARLVREGGQWSLVDLSSVNGIYLKVQGKKVLMDGDLILLGQQVLKFETVMEAEQALHPAFQHGVALFGTPQIPRFARLCQRTVEGITRDVYHIHRPEVSMGRETADIVFSDDPFLSRRHAVLKLQSSSEGTQSFLLEDAGSSNGTFVAIRGRERLSGGEVLRIGLHLFRVELTDKEGGRS